MDEQKIDYFHDWLEYQEAWQKRYRPLDKNYLAEEYWNVFDKGCARCHTVEDSIVTAYDVNEFVDRMTYGRQHENEYRFFAGIYGRITRDNVCEMVKIAKACPDYGGNWQSYSHRHRNPEYTSFVWEIAKFEEHCWPKPTWGKRLMGWLNNLCERHMRKTLLGIQTMWAE